MNDDFHYFGLPDQFEIAARWSPDHEPRAHLPLAEGWSTGQLRITVCGQVLTEHRFRGERHDALSWYLSPLIDWLIRNWTWLLHEETLAWTDKSGQAAAAATFSALERTIASADAVERKAYASIHAWWARHALRAADSSATYPDIYFRRLADDIEISWLSRQPGFAPQGFSLTLVPGYALLPVDTVAKAFWQFLTWATASAPATNAVDRATTSNQRERFLALREIPLAQLEQAYIGERVQRLLDAARAAAQLATDGKCADDLPAIESLDSAVLMFGGLHVELTPGDVRRLVDFLAERKGQSESAALSRLTQNPNSEAWSRPHEEGYLLAAACRDELGIAPDRTFVDMEAVLDRLGIAVQHCLLETNSIRGVAVAGEAYAPAIMINENSCYNNNPPGRRFTLAHELCHILHDRTRARKLSHVSGPWASARIEKRANAFAAMFLAPPSAIRQKLADVTPEAVRMLANQVGMGVTALVEHLYNTDLIDDAERERLRQAL